MFVALLALSLLSFDPDLGPGPESCNFLPLVERYLLPPEHPCYLPSPPPPPPPPCDRPEIECNDGPL